MFGRDLDQINERPNENGTFLDLVFTNVPADMAVEGAKTPLLRLDSHHKAYEIEMQICSCNVDAIKGGVKRYRFKLVDCVAIVDELDAVDWCSFFFRVEGSTNAWTYSTKWSGAAFEDMMCLGDILAVIKICHG
jgi:hypothetical protein